MKKNEINIDGELDSLRNLERIEARDLFSDELMKRIENYRKPRKTELNIAVFAIILLINALSVYSIFSKSDDDSVSRSNELRNLTEIFSLND